MHDLSNKQHFYEAKEMSEREPSGHCTLQKNHIVHFF